MLNGVTIIKGEVSAIHVNSDTDSVVREGNLSSRFLITHGRIGVKGK